MNDDDRRRLAEIASKVRRGVRHPEIAAACEGVLAMAAERNVTGSIERKVTGKECPVQSIDLSEPVINNTVRSSSSISFSLHMARFARLLILPLALEAKKKPQRELVVRYLPLGGRVAALTWRMRLYGSLKVSGSEIVD
jgi:hypothetical protein